MNAEARQALIAELIAIRAWEHQFQDFDSLRDRGAEIQAALSLPVTTQEQVAA